MRYNNNFKALVLLVLLFASVSSATAYSSAFTTSPPDTQNTGEEFTIAGEVETDWFWESDLESIMIQSKTEGSSTWFVEYEKDTGCYGSSCSVSYSGLSHDTAEDVEYRVVASNTRGNTRPVSPSTETVEFIDEVSVTISNIRSTDSSIQEGDDTEFKADISSNLELTAAPVKFYVDGKLIGLTYVNPDAGSSETADLSTNWASLSDKVVTDDDHDITVEVEADGQTFSKTKDEAFYLGEAEEDLSVEISNIRSTDSTIQEGDDTEFKADITPSKDVSYLQFSFTSEGEQIGYVQEYNLDGESTVTVSADSDWETLSDSLPADQDHDLTVTARNSDIEVSETVTEAFYLESEEGDSPSVDIKNIRSTDSNIQEDESTELKVDIESDQNINYLDVEFRSDGEVLATEQVTDTIPAYNEETITSEALSWNDLSDQLDTGQEHDVEVVLNGAGIDVSSTESNVFTLAEAEEEGPDVDVTNIRSTDTEIEEGESTEFEFDIESDQDIGYLEVDFRSDGEVLATKQITDTIPANNEETITSESLSWNDLSDQLDTDEDYDLEIVLNGAGIDESFSEEDVFNLLGSEPSQRVQITDLRSTNTHIDEGEDSEF